MEVWGGGVGYRVGYKNGGTKLPANRTRTFRPVFLLIVQKRWDHLANGTRMLSSHYSVIRHKQEVVIIIRFHEQVWHKESLPASRCVDLTLLWLCTGLPVT